MKIFIIYIAFFVRNDEMNIFSQAELSLFIIEFWRTINTHGHNERHNDWLYWGVGITTKSQAMSKNSGR